MSMKTGSAPGLADPGRCTSPDTETKRAPKSTNVLNKTVTARNAGFSGLPSVSGLVAP
jgi:hypothetical protein